jgi:uncharacterized protein YggE
MEQKYLITAGTAALLLLCLFLIVIINDKLTSVDYSKTVMFTGEGKVMAKPDVAVANLSILTESSSSKTAQDSNSAKSKTVTDFLKAQGIEEKDIRTSSYNVYPQYWYPSDSRPQISGYQVNQTMEVKIRNLDNVSKIMDGVVSAGVNQINNLSFVIDDPEALKAEARSKAINDAKNKAKNLEDQIDLNLGRIVNFSENINGWTPLPAYERAVGLGGGGGGPTLPTGENEIIISVTLTYQIQ